MPVVASAASARGHVLSAVEAGTSGRASSSRSNLLVALEPRAPDGAPFSAADYLQLAATAGRSVVIEAGGGEIVVVAGVLHAAHDELGEGETAFFRIALAPTARCRPLVGAPPPSNAAGRCEHLLMEAARRYDEAHSGEGACCC